MCNVFTFSKFFYKLFFKLHTSSLNFMQYLTNKKVHIRSYNLSDAVFLATNFSRSLQLKYIISTKEGDEINAFLLLTEKILLFVMSLTKVQVRKVYSLGTKTFLIMLDFVAQYIYLHTGCSIQIAGILKKYSFIVCFCQKNFI